MAILILALRLSSSSVFPRILSAGSWECLFFILCEKALALGRVMCYRGKVDKCEWPREGRDEKAAKDQTYERDDN